MNELSIAGHSVHKNSIYECFFWSYAGKGGHHPGRSRRDRRNAGVADT